MSLFSVFPACAPISLFFCVFGPTMDEDIHSCWGSIVGVWDQGYVDWMLSGACVKSRI